MADIEKDLQELKREAVESRNLVIKADNQLKNLHAALKQVAEKQETFERRSFVSSATAYILFMAVATLGAYMFARGEIQSRGDARVAAEKERDAARATLQAQLDEERERKAEEGAARALFEQLSGGDSARRSAAIDTVAALKPKRLSELEVRALQDKSLALRADAANEAFENGRSAFNRKEWKTVTSELRRYLALTPGKIDDTSHLLLGQAHHALKEFKEASEELEAYLKNNASAKNGDWFTLLLGEALAESGEKTRAIDVYRSGADRYYQSQFSSSMRARARRLETGGSGTGPGGPSSPTPPASPVAVPGTVPQGRTTPQASPPPPQN